MSNQPGDKQASTGRLALTPIDRQRFDSLLRVLDQEDLCAIRALNTLLRLLDIIGEAHPEVDLHRAYGLCHRVLSDLHLFEELFTVERDCNPADLTCEVAMVLKPTNCFSELIATCVALNVELDRIQIPSHSGPPESCENARLAGTGEGGQ